MSAYSALILASSPLAYYRLTETTVAFDQTSNHYDAQIIGGVTTQQQSAIISDSITDFSMLFDGSTGYLKSVPGLSTNGLAALTVECWINLSNNTFAYYPNIMGNDNTKITHNGFYLQAAPTSDGASAFFFVGNGVTFGGKTFGTGAGTFTPGTWHHLVGIYDGAHVFGYVDGVLDQTNANPALTGNVGNTANSVFIGTFSLVLNLFPGLIDEVAIYPSALTESVIVSHFLTGARGQAGLIPFPAATRRQL